MSWVNTGFCCVVMHHLRVVLVVVFLRFGVVVAGDGHVVGDRHVVGNRN